MHRKPLSYMNKFSFLKKINNNEKLIILILLFGFLYRLLITSNGNFIFNMDNARDFVDVREMVILGIPRLTGPTSGIEGFYNGPFWYYLLAIPFVLTGGNPYGGILLMIVLWTIGGFFLLKIVSRYGLIPMLIAGSIWVASDFIVLASVYSFNPSPILFLTPLFIYLMEVYLKKNSLRISFLLWFLGGLFFNFEMAFGIFIPLIILTATLVLKKEYLRTKNFWIGTAGFILTILPQFIFDARHNFIMTNSILRYLNENQSQNGYSVINRFLSIGKLYLDTLLPTLLNWKPLFYSSLGLLAFLIFYIFKKKKKETLLYITLISTLVPFLGHVFIPTNVMPWHLDGVMAAVILLLVIAFYKLGQISSGFKILIGASAVVVLIFSIYKLELPKNILEKKISNDPSVFSNEIAAVEYVYQKASGKNFKVYTYLPSVIDYPYQYLFWWWGLKKYGYLPKDYAYSPNKPPYIKNKDMLISKNSPLDSNLVFLIKEPDRIKIRHLWENDFKKLKLVEKTMLGPLEIEIRQE